MTQTDSTTSSQPQGYRPIITRELLARMFAHVHVVYWPVLLLNILYIRTWANTVDYDGDGYIAVRFNKHGVIQLKWAGHIFKDAPEALGGLDWKEALTLPIPAWAHFSNDTHVEGSPSYTTPSAPMVLGICREWGSAIYAGPG